MASRLPGMKKRYRTFDACLWGKDNIGEQVFGKDERLVEIRKFSVIQQLKTCHCAKSLASPNLDLDNSQDQCPQIGSIYFYFWGGGGLRAFIW